MKHNNFKNILITYKSIVDEDKAIVDYMLDNHFDSRYIKPELKDATDYYIKYLLVTRTDINPLTILLQDKYMNSADNLLNEIKRDKYEEVLKYTSLTDLSQVLNMIYKNAGYNITVNCEDNRKVLYLKKYNKYQDWNYAVEVKDINKYFCLICHDYKELMKYNKTIGKSIYLADCGFNYEDYSKKDIHLTLKIMSYQNEIKTYSVYSNFEFPM